jgi:DNA primase catalytic core
MLIPQDVIDRLQELNIETVATKLGMDVKRHKALCFMHNDHTPSIAFSKTKNMYKCWVCGVGGGPIKLVQDKEGWNFQEACKWLAKEFNIVLPEQKMLKKPVKKVVRRTYLLNKEDKVGTFDIEVFNWLIETAGLSKTANIFLFEQRYLKKNVIQSLNIKSVTDSKKAVVALESRFGKERCQKSGIVRKGDYGDFFYFYTPCLLFPYYEQDGRLAGVQSRYLGENKKAPRFQFLSSQKTRLFNLPILNNLKRGDSLYITEGITDCLAMLSAGLNAVAIPSATILPLEDMILLKNYDLHMYPDQDEAGRRAFMEIRRFFVQHYTTVKVEQLPKGTKDYSDYYILTQEADGKE